MEQIQDKPICIREVNENLRLIKLGEPLTRSLLSLQTHCKFKEKYKEWCDIQDGIEHYILRELSCVICNKKFKQINYNQICCSRKCLNIRRNKRGKAYREENKDKIAKRGKAYYEENKDKIAKRKKAYYEKNKEKIIKRGKDYYE